MKSKTNDSWASLLSTALAKKGKLPEGPNWKTFDQLMAENRGSSNNAVRKAISALVREGKLDVFSGAEVVDGVTRRRVFYRPKTA